MSYDNELNDPTLCSRETVAILTGLGVANLSNFIERGISLEDLQYVTDEDLSVLDPGESFNKNTFKQMQESLQKRFANKQLKIESGDWEKILNNEYKQLCVITIFLKFVLSVLKKEENQYFDCEKNLTTSDALMIATNSILNEVTELDKTIDEIMERTQGTLVEDKKPNKSGKKKRKMIAAVSSAAVLLLIIKLIY
ncbi:uncharacterized protein LOC106653708 [Trichogramma pretiosum]|uniref:uncharacterized protein LOC106653708 n=1 Tax=Trichogramma pretiosum TaxID=7493 RepID=UPI0006C99CD9|nr:uncharacterized protein LOC106653708 [Trichogramma pretiosum]